MDMVLDRKILKVAVNYFVVLGIISVIAMSLGLLGIFTQRSFDTVSLDTRSTNSIDSLGIQVREFGLFTSWSDFTSNCCCMLSKSSELAGIEYWRCRETEISDFKYKVLKIYLGSSSSIRR
eukprot:NODE_670_length_5356_cov_0.415066.p5 type:complete len:121 gc:universal NODE_670_length_5356_cov_0.415066:412-774(+)